MTFWAILKNITFKDITVDATFRTTFGNIWATFSDIWSHCSQLVSVRLHEER